MFQYINKEFWYTPEKGTSSFVQSEPYIRFAYAEEVTKNFSNVDEIIQNVRKEQADAICTFICDALGNNKIDPSQDTHVKRIQMKNTKSNDPSRT